jgi:hypothetical protein
LLERIHLFDEDLWVNDDPRPDHRSAMRIEDAGGNKVQGILLAVHDDRVAGVVTTLVTDHNVGLGGEQVGDFSFALVPPLDPDESDSGHYRSALSIRNLMRTCVRYSEMPPSITVHEVSMMSISVMPRMVFDAS